MDLADLFVRAVRCPERLEVRDIRACTALLTTGQQDGADTCMALRALLATIYARPELLDSAVIDRLRCFVSHGDSTRTTTSLTSAIWQGLVMTPLGAGTLRVIEDLLAVPVLPDTTQVVLLDALEHAALWRRDLLDSETVISLCECEHLAAFRERILTQVVEPCLLARPDIIDDSMARRLRDLFARHSQPAYCLAYLASRADVDESARRAASAANRDRFLLAQRVGSCLTEGQQRILVVYNVDDSQGDEIIRVVPLLQALLDCNPATHATVLTPRRYLYAHPRLSPVAIDHGPAVHAALQEEYDIVIDFFHPTLNHGTGLERAILEYGRTRHPILSLGCSNADESYVYDRLEVDGRPWAEARGLDRQQRPVALVNPFGGHEALKGYVDGTLGQLAGRLRADRRRLLHRATAERHAVGGSEKDASALALLQPDERMYVVSAPDLRPRGTSTSCACSDVPLPFHSSLMRHFLQFVRRADLIVAVEGWAIHVAYLLGKPYRALILPCSIPVPWLPYGGTRRQVIADPLDVPPSSLSDTHDEPPLDELPRSLLLRSLLAALGECPELDILPPLLGALRSQDRQTRLEDSTYDTIKSTLPGLR